MAVNPIPPVFESRPLYIPRNEGDGSWRTPGCGERCRVYYVTFAGKSFDERMVSHDPLHHEAYGERALIAAYANLGGRTVTVGALTMNGATHEVTVGGIAAHLTPIESGILFYLAANVGRVCVHEELLRHVWGEEYAGSFRGGRQARAQTRIESHLLRVNMARLRAKLGYARDLIQTVIATGYMLTDRPLHGGRS